MQYVINRIGMDLRAMLMLCVLGLILTVPLTGCAEKTVAVSVTGYDHMKDSSIADFSVNGASGLNLAPESGGGGEMCCVAIPAHWHPGLKATVKWEYGYGSGESGPPFPPQEAVVDIQEYTPENLGNVQVHFYPNHKIKVVVSKYELGHPKNPLPKEDWAPWKIDQNVERNERELEEEQRKK